MPTDTERREVARRLRNMGYDDTKESLICAYLDALGVEGEWLTWVEIAHRLADLIEPESERTCHVESSHVEQEMGDYSYLEVELSCGHAFTWDDVTPPDFCPYCGARVVSE